RHRRQSDSCLQIRAGAAAGFPAPGGSVAESPHLHAEVAERLLNCAGASNRTRRAVEPCEEAVPCGVYLHTAEASELRSHDCVVLDQEVRRLGAALKRRPVSSKQLAYRVMTLGAKPA